MGLALAASVLGVAVALSEITRAKLTDADFGSNLGLWSGCASPSSGIELVNHEIVVLGMSRAWSGPLVLSRGRPIPEWCFAPRSC
jgi:cyanuric acid amidohydrolase